MKHFLGAKKSVAHWASYLVQQGNVDAHHSVQIGIRGNTRTEDWLKPSYEHGDHYGPLQTNRCLAKYRYYL